MPKQINGKWKAYLHHEKKQFTIGTFKRKKEAVAAEEQLQREYKRIMRQDIDKVKLYYEYQ